MSENPSSRPFNGAQFTFSLLSLLSSFLSVFRYFIAFVSVFTSSSFNFM